MNDQQQMNLEMNSERVDNEFWIDRSGKVHKYKGDLSETIISFHHEIAQVLFPQSTRPTDALFNLGWCAVGSVVYNIPIMHKEPSQAQLNTLDELGWLNRLNILDNGYYVRYAI